MKSVKVWVSALVAACGSGLAWAGPIIAAGQFFDGVVRENRFYEIDPVTGQATPLSPALGSVPAALAGAPDGRLLSYSNGVLRVVDRISWAGVGLPVFSGLSTTALDVLEDGRGFAVTNSGARSTHRLDTTTGEATLVGDPNAIQQALDAFFSLPPGTSQPFIIGLGSAGGTLYGVNVESGRTNLVAIDPDTGSATVLGAPNVLATLNGGRYSGFASMTGVDTDSDGDFDALYGGLNFDNAFPNPPQSRAGGVVRYDLATGTYSIIGTNPGIIWFSFASFPSVCPGRGAGACGPGDWNEDGTIDFNDLLAFLNDYNAQTRCSDTNGDGAVDFNDLLEFLNRYNTPC